MSASLVGSEMCIRDSSFGALSALPRRAPEGARQPRAAGRPVGAHGRSPVSYTHLTLPTICSV
eukprot:13013281-Alexandrium_andersonii.AAC.1